jgi:hypothetical protein
MSLGQQWLQGDLHQDFIIGRYFQIPERKINSKLELQLQPHLTLILPSVIMSLDLLTMDLANSAITRMLQAHNTAKG